MKIYSDVNIIRKQLEQSIDKFGYSPDHNLDWLIYCSDEGDPNVAMWDDGSIIWFYRNTLGRCSVLCDPISLIPGQEEILREFIDYALQNCDSCEFIDVRDGVRNIIDKLYPNKIKPDYEIIWPVVDIQSFDPLLPSGHFKDLRNALHKFNREHVMTVQSTADIPVSDLHNIVDRWFQNRALIGIEVLPGRYHKMIDNGFRGTKSSRVMFVDGHPAGFNAGWETPNNPVEWSASIGIHDYSVKDLGIILMHEDLAWIKNAGYRTCDLEGSELKALKFKTQFFNECKTYKTYTFNLENSGR